jgi:carbonic anhydrase
MSKLLAFMLALALSSPLMAETSSKPIKASAKDEASADDSKPLREGKSGSKEGKDSKDSKDSKSAKGKEKQEALETDELAAKIAEKLAQIRKDKEDGMKPSAAAMARSVARPVVRTPLVARSKTMADNKSMADEKSMADVMAHAEIHWSYEGEGGPMRWGKINSSYSKCDTGERQSPIDIRDGIKVNLDPVGFDYKLSRFNVIDNGHTIQVNVGAGNYINLQGRNYELVQFHFHKPSEERIEGRGFEMVVHLVHKNADGKLAVVAVLLEPGQANNLIQTIWNNLPLEKYEVVQPLGTIDLKQILPEHREYYTYMGSLTTPPCTEGVLWIVMKQTMEISSDQLAIFSRLYPMNARPIQNTAGRLIKESN